MCYERQLVACVYYCSTYYKAVREGGTYDGNPLVDVRTGAGHADVRLGGLWNRHVWKKGTIYFE
jgi:hypothetical protein